MFCVVLEIPEKLKYIQNQLHTAYDFNRPTNQILIAYKDIIIFAR